MREREPFGFTAIDVSFSCDVGCVREREDRVGEGIRRYFKEHAAPEGAAFRVGVRGGGCSGLSYVLEVDTDTRRDGDLVLDADGIEVRVDKKSLKVLEGSVLDFKFGLMDAGFRFENPRAVKACGCGESFSLA